LQILKYAGKTWQGQILKLLSLCQREKNKLMTSAIKPFSPSLAVGKNKLERFSLALSTG
jgi:hypothetical protein